MVEQRVSHVASIVQKKEEQLESHKQQKWTKRQMELEEFQKRKERHSYNLQRHEQIVDLVKSQRQSKFESKRQRVEQLI